MTLGRTFRPVNTILSPRAAPSSVEHAEVCVEFMNKKIEVLKGLGVKVIGETIASTDASLFCDSFHPNEKGREVFSKEIVLP